jgi:hypothetical protein
MATTSQINANRENAKSSTGPTTQAGSERSSRNALRHGYTGQTLVLTPEEGEAYAAHVELYMNRHQPALADHRQLIQQLADADWGVHQIFTAQTAQISLMNILTLQLSEAGADVTSMIKSSAQVARTLATLTSYENRKRRTSKAIEEQLNEIYQRMAEELEAQEAQAKPPSKPKETNTEPEIGFVHPSPIKPVSPAEFARQAAAFDAAVTALEAEKGVVSDEEAFELLQKYR